MAPDDGNMNLLKKAGTQAQKDKWLKPIVEGRVRSSVVMTEPAPGGGSDPSMIKTYAEKHGNTWKIFGRKWFITGAAAASHFIVAARTSDDKRKGITTFLHHKDQPGWRIVRRIPILGPEEHGGHCELEYDGLEVHDDDVLGGVGNGLKMVQVRLGPRASRIACAGSAGRSAAWRLRRSTSTAARASASSSPTARACR
jgi:acyl-CoA dehydrogenase